MKFKLASYRHLRERIADVEEPENFAFITTALWRTLLVLFTTSAVLSIAYGFSLVRGVLALSDISNVTAQKSLSSDPDSVALNAIVVSFAARKDHYDQLKAQPLTVPDPSQ